MNAALLRAQAAVYLHLTEVDVALVLQEREQQQNNDELLAAAQHAEELRAEQEQQDEVFARQVQWELQQSAAAAPRDLAPPADAGSLVRLCC